MMRYGLLILVLLLLPTQVWRRSGGSLMRQDAKSRYRRGWNAFLPPARLPLSSSLPSRPRIAGLDAHPTPDEAALLPKNTPHCRLWGASPAAAAPPIWKPSWLWHLISS